MLKSKHQQSDLTRLESDPNPVWLLDINRKNMRWINSAGLSLWQIDSLEELPAETLIGEPNLEKVNYLIERKEGHLPIRDSWSVQKDDDKRVYLADYQFVTLVDDSPAVLVKLITDSPTKPNPSTRDIESVNTAAMSERAEVHERYRALFELASEAIAISDVDSRLFIDVNPRFEQLFGVDLNELNHGKRNFYDLSPVVQPDGGDSLKRAGVYTRRAIAGESLSFEWTFIDLEGHPFPTVMRLSRFPDPRRRLLRTSITDLSDLREAEEKRRELEEQLAQSQKLESLGQLTGGIAHDFNNILAVILGNMELLADETRDSYHAELIQTAIAATERGSRITRSMLAFARKSDLQPETLNLEQILASLEDWITSSLPSSIVVSTQCPDDLYLIRADHTGAERTLLNLVINARDAMPDGGSLTISADNYEVLPDSETLPEGSYVRLSVVDTGIGIADDAISQVFDPFFSTKQVTENSGLGLSMVHGYMKQSGGEVRIHSVVDEGTTFELIFPALVDARPTQDNSGDRHEITHVAALNVLLVEDEVDLLDALTRILEKAGHTVSAAKNGDEAATDYLDKASEFDLLVSDIDMPGKLQGPDLAKKMRVRNQDLAVVLLSGYSTATSKDELRLQKPISRKKLIEAIDKVLQGKSQDT